ncbi:hypothetical protein G6F24_018530 [Rhizopus arrhizus]|nr:hypothetical protein G6F24_018530 [Rhizopus arrhizus]
MAPGQSKRPWGAPTVGRTLTATMTAPSTPTPPVARNTHSQPAACTIQPDARGANDRPTPKVVPSKLNARVRATPWNSGANDDMAAANAAAPPMPCISRMTSIQPVVGR